MPLKTYIFTNREFTRGENQMISFVNDYSENACPEILSALLQTELEKNSPYSSDIHSKRATELIRNKIQCPDAEIQILMGGTQTNLIAACAFLRPHEAIIAVTTGHIAVHETGAIEGTGHKVIEVYGENGKITVADIEKICGPQHWDHAGILTVKPRMVYISQCTEVGTVYSKKDLLDIRKVCDKYNLLLYCDGARLGSALDCSDVTLPFLAQVCDAFYIGGTKNAALFGEALIVVKDELKPEFRYIAKQRGGMLAKGWLLGLQFEILMQNNLYEKYGKHSNDMAKILKMGLKELGIRFSVNSPSNQLFPIFPNVLLEQLQKEYSWEVINIVDGENTEIRLVTSWSTKEEEIRAFLNSVKTYIELMK